jgi:hypothetical protein
MVLALLGLLCPLAGGASVVDADDAGPAMARHAAVFGGHFARCNKKGSSPIFGARRGVGPDPSAPRRSALNHKKATK